VSKYFSGKDRSVPLEKTGPYAYARREASGLEAINKLN